ncbi:MAG TPA: 4Fe-4S binding protein [Actinobacteria bacterium]|jgi:ferredoxin|nr:4Fe-4S binding protein [Actinomycetota bacterium]
MTAEKLILNFPKNVVTKPIVYHVVKDFDLEFNILRAEITPNLEGKMLLEIRGEKDKIEECKNFFKKEGVQIREATQEIILDKELCVNCGVCISLCFSNALSINKDTFEIEFNKNKCVLCGICLNGCPVNALKSKI